jgi:PAS domain S-box-containing protein
LSLRFEKWWPAIRKRETTSPASGVFIAEGIGDDYCDTGTSRLLRNALVDASDVSVFEVAAEAASLGVWDWDLTTGRITYSTRAREICGFGGEASVNFEAVRSVVHPDDLPRTSAMAQRAMESPEAPPEPYRYRILRADTGELRWVLAHGRAVFETANGAQRATRYIGTIQDVTAQHGSEAALVESEERLRFAIEAGKMAVWELDLDRNAITPSRELNLLCGFTADAKPTLEDFRSRYAPGEGERIEQEGAEIRARGETEIQTTFRQLWPGGTEKWLLLRARLAPPSDKIKRRVIGVLIDVTAQKRAELRAETIASEMQHRVKNTLAVVQALAEQSLRGKSDVGEAGAALAGRLRALAIASGAVTTVREAGGDIRLIVDQILAPYREAGTDRFVITGRAAHLPARQATVLALALHELATNAIKYGALSSEHGQVEIEWTKQRNQLDLRWRESGGPPVQPKAASGFGMKLLERGLMGAEPALVNFAPGGVTCSLTLPLDD